MRHLVRKTHLFPQPTSRFLMLGIFLLGAFLLPPSSWADYGTLTGRSLVVPGQGITATSRVTEVVRITVSETNTDNLQTPENDDDGGLEIRRVHVSFENLRNIPDITQKVAFVSLYRASQDIDSAGFDFDRDFDPEKNILLARGRVTGTVVTLDVPCEELATRVADPCVVNVDMLTETIKGQGGNAFVVNGSAIFFVAIETDARLENNDQFSVVMEIRREDIAHQHGKANPFGIRRFASEIITCVDQVGDLMPFPDVVTGGSFDFIYPFEPHNYTDRFAQHPDALNILEDMEVPQVLPSESSQTAVLGIEIAGVHSYFNYVLLNFTSNQDGRNNDHDYWADDPAGNPGVYDPQIDEIFRKNTWPPVNRFGYVVREAGDTVLFAGATPGVQTTRWNVDDDADGQTDEELPNGKDDDGDSRIDEDISLPILHPLVDEDSKNLWAWVDENNNGTYDPATDELYFDYNGNGVLDVQAGIPQVSDVPERVFAGANGIWTLRAGDPYSNPGKKSQFFAFDEDGDGEGGSPLSPNIWTTVPVLTSPAFPDNPFIRNPYVYAWPSASGIYNLTNPGLGYSSVKMANGLDDDNDSDDYADLNSNGMPDIGEPGVDPVSGKVMADGVDNDGDGEAQSPLDALGRAMADGIDNDEDGLIDEGIDEDIDEGINEDPGDNAFNPLTARRNPFGTYDNFVGDIDGVWLYQDNGDGVFDPATDTAISRSDPEQRDWTWLNVSPPVYSMLVVVDSAVNSGKGAIVPKTDNGTYDFFVVITLDGDDRGDYFNPGSRFPNPPGVKSGILLEDYEGVKPGDDFMVSIARGSTPTMISSFGVVSGIGTTAGYPNASKLSKPTEAKMFIDDVIGYVPDTIQGDDDVNFMVHRPERPPITVDDDIFVGNPYLDALSSPVGVIGINVADNPGNDVDVQDFLDSVTVRVQSLKKDLVLRGVEYEGLFDIIPSGSIVSLPDLMPLADDSTGGIGIYRDNPDSGIPGGFDSQDLPVPLRSDSLQYKLVPGTTDTVEVTLKPTTGLVLPPDDSQAANAGYDYYVVVRTSKDIDYRDVFRVSISDGGVLFRSGPSVQNSGVNTDTIAANVPVIPQNLTLLDPEPVVASLAPGNSGYAVLGFNMYDRSLADVGDLARTVKLPTNLHYMIVNFANVGADNQFTIEDLAPIGTGTLNRIQVGDGVALYRDNHSTVPPSKPGIFDETDILVEAVPLIGNIDGYPNSVFLFFDPFGEDPNGDYNLATEDINATTGVVSAGEDAVIGERIPRTDTGVFEGNDYFLVVRPDADISNGDDFKVQVRPLVFNNVVQWPMEFLPDARFPLEITHSQDAGGGTELLYQEVNGVFRLNHSYKAVETNTLVATTQTDTVFSDLTTIGETIEALSDPKAVIGININDQGNPQRTISRISFEIISSLVGGNPTSVISDFNPFSPTPNSGFALYRDNTNLGIQGAFDPADEFLSLVPSGSSATQVAVDRIRVELTFSPGVAVPDDDAGNNSGADFFVVVRTSNTISFKDQFRVRIESSGVVFESGDSFGNTNLTTNWLTTNVPVFAVDTTGFFGASFNRNDGPEDVIGLNFLTSTQASPANSNEKLVSLVVQLNKFGNSAFTNSDLAPLSNSTSSGIALYVDNGSVTGRFDTGDTFLPLANAPVYVGNNEVFLRLLNPLALPARDLFNTTDFGPDVYIVLRTSGSITRDSVFTVAVRNIRFENTLSLLQFETQPIDGGKVNEPPFIELLTPKTGDTANSTFSIKWQDFDPDSNASINLFYVSNDDYLANGSSFDGLSINRVYGPNRLTIAENLAEDPDEDADAFLWDVSLVNTMLFEPLGNPRLAELRVGARISDGVSADAKSASPNFITITNATPTLVFTGVSGVQETDGDGVPRILAGNSFSIGFSAGDPEGRGEADIFLVDKTVFASVIQSATAKALFAVSSELDESQDVINRIVALSPDNIYHVNGPVFSITRTTVGKTTVEGSIFGSFTSGSPRTFVSLAYIRDIVSGSREFASPVVSGPTQTLVRVYPNRPPTFAFTGPLDTDNPALEIDGNNRFLISWNDSEPDASSIASITLTYEKTTGGGQQVVRGLLPGTTTPIVDAKNILQSDPANVFTWDLSTLEYGEYIVRGRIRDELSVVEDQGRVLLNRPSEFVFTQPTADTSTFSGVDLNIQWIDRNPDLDDNERLRFFLVELGTNIETDLTSRLKPCSGSNQENLPNPLTVADPANCALLSTADIPSGTYNLLVRLTNTTGQSQSVLARRADSSPVRIIIVRNDPPQLAFRPLSLTDVVDANPSITTPTLGGVVSDPNAVIPIVWNDRDDPPLTAQVELFFSTGEIKFDGSKAIEGTFPPSVPSVITAVVPLATDNGPGPYPGRGAFVIPSASDVFFWNITNAASVPAGTFTVVARVSDGINAPLVVQSPNTIRINRRPSIQFTGSLPANISRGDDVTLLWNDTDADSNARIEIRYSLDTNNDGVRDTSWVLIPTASSIAEDPDGNGDRFVFDTSQISPYPPSVFRLFFQLTIRDEVNSATVVVPDAGGMVVNPNSPPSLELVRPNRADQEDATGFVRVYPDTLVRAGVFPPFINIAWQNGMDDNPDTTFALFFDRDRFGADGTAIVQVDPMNLDSTRIPLTATGSFLWDVSAVPPGDYYVYALLRDSANAPVAVYSPAFVRINQPPTFTFLDPDGVNDEVFPGEPFTVAWSDTDPDSNAVINLFLDNDSDLTNGFGINVADLNPGNLALGIFEDDETDRLDVNTSTLVTGNYIVVARIDDGINIPRLYQSSFPLVIKPRPDGPPRLIVTQPSGGSPTNPLVVSTPILTVQWVDDPVPDSRVNQSFIQFYWDTDFFGTNGTILSGTDVAFDGSVINANRIPVELRPSDPNFPVRLRDQDQFRFDVKQFPTGQVLYLYAIITDTGRIEFDEEGRLIQGQYSSEVYSSNAFIINSSPTFRWIVPGQGTPSELFHPVNPRGNPLPVTFDARDPDSVALIDLYLDTDMDSSNGLIPIEDPGQNIHEENGVSTITLNLADEVKAASVPQVYRILAQVTDGSALSEIYSGTFTVVQNVETSLEVITPATDIVVPRSGLYTLEWFDDDPDSNAMINLFLDFDTVGGSGIVIPGTYETTFGTFLSANDIPENEDNGRMQGSRKLDRFLWDLSRTDPGTYYVGVRARDGANDVYAYSPGRVIVNSPPVFAWVNPPIQGAKVLQGDSFNLQWTDADDDAATIITFYLDLDGITFNGNEIAVPNGSVLLQNTADNLSFNTAFLNVTSPSIVVTPIAVVDDGVNPRVIVRSEGSITIDWNDPPRLQVLEPRREAVLFDNLFTLKWTDSDPDSSASIDFFLDTNNRGADGVPLDAAQDLPEDDEADQLEVDFSDIAPGRYWLYGVIDDGFNRPFASYAPAPINILAGTETVQYAVYLLSAFGDVLPVGDVRYRFTGLPTSPAGDYKAIELTAAGTTLFTLKRDGTIGQYGVPRVTIGDVPPPMGEYVDLELTPDEKGLVLLDSSGRLVSLGTAPNFNGMVMFLGLVGDPSVPHAVDLELTEDGLGAYVLDNFGGIHVFGTATQFNEIYFFGMDMARDLELDSQGGYVLDAFGHIYPLGRSSVLSDGADFDFDIARDMILFDKGGFYILDGQGGITAVGNNAIVAPTNEPAPNPYFPGLDVIKDFALAGTVELTDAALEVLSTVRRFEVAYRNEDLDSIVPTIATDYDDGVHLSRTQLLNGVFDQFNQRIADGILQDWEDTVDQLGGPLAGFFLENPVVTFNETGDQATVAVTAKRMGYRSATSEIEIPVRVPAPLLVTFSVQERDQISPDVTFDSPVPTTLWMRDPGDHRGIIVYVDKSFKDIYGNNPDPKEWEFHYKYSINNGGLDQFRIQLPGNADFRILFVTATQNLEQTFPPDERPITFGRFVYSALTDVALTFKVQRKGPVEWQIIEINPIGNLIP